jgi:hypothetical protein
MTDKRELIRVLEVYEDTTGAYKLGDIDYAINVDVVDRYLKTYGKKDLIKKLKFLQEYVLKKDKELKRKLK